jgi:hypothetical protein
MDPKPRVLLTTITRVAEMEVQRGLRKLPVGTICIDEVQVLTRLNNQKKSIHSPYTIHTSPYPIPHTPYIHTYLLYFILRLLTVTSKLVGVKSFLTGK